MKRSHVGWARVAVLLILTATAFAVFAYHKGIQQRAAVGRTAPDFAVPSADGTISLSSLSGKVVVLNFYASWCDVCALEAPALETFERRYGDEVSVLGIDWREPMKVAQTFAESHGGTYRVARDVDGTVAKAYGLTGVPETWVIDPKGKATDHIIGGATFEHLLISARQSGAGTRASLSPANVAIPAGESVRALTTLDGRLWAVLSSGRGLSSGDGGLSWSQVGPSPDAIPTLQATEAAANLSAASGLPQAVDVHALDFAGQKGYLATNDGLFVSQDGGRNWHATKDTQPLAEAAAMSAPGMAMVGQQPLQAWAVAIDAGGTAYFAADQGVWAREGKGPAKPMVGTPDRKFTGIALLNGVLWAMTPDGDLYFKAVASDLRRGPSAPPEQGAERLPEGWFRVVPQSAQ